MTPLQAVVTIVCAIIAVAGVITSAILGYKQFMLKRQDEIEANSVDAKIDKAISNLRKEMMEIIEGVSIARSKEGAERFNTHAKALSDVNKQIEANSKQISELTEISRKTLKSVSELSDSVESSVKSQRNNNYDRLLMVGRKALSTKQITLSEKTNLKQLYESYRELKGNDPYIETLMEECNKLTPIPDKEVI